MAAKKGSVTVTVSVGDIEISVESVTLDEAESMASHLTRMAARLRRKHKSLRSYVETVPGGSATEFVDDDYADESRQVGFAQPER